ncbi:hypothetical protein SO802_012277 [Lithocarpus litseifolius]|uniref:Reverse transcriptase zinc-binding domain-containing protein n=1 Tax=Lithocarpus litseifolius TaxID=425828 RepID=A0AAW2D7Q2_9ROSI
MVSALIDTNTRSWKVEFIRSLFLPFEAITILNMPLSHNLPEDKIIWTRGITDGVLYPSYDGVPETISHALIDCEVAKRVWDCWKDCPVNLVSNYWVVSDSALEIITAGTSTDLENFFVAAWVIWYNRNQIVFEYTCQLPYQIWNFAMDYLKDVHGNRRSQLLHRTVESGKWETPPCGPLKSMLMEPLLSKEEILGLAWSLGTLEERFSLLALNISLVCSL